MNTLQMDYRGPNTHQIPFNIPPPPTSHIHDTFLPSNSCSHTAGPAHSESSSSPHSSLRNEQMRRSSSAARDTDSDNNRPRTNGEYGESQLLIVSSAFSL